MNFISISFICTDTYKLLKFKIIIINLIDFNNHMTFILCSIVNNSNKCSIVVKNQFLDRKKLLTIFNMSKKNF